MPVLERLQILESSILVLIFSEALLYIVLVDFIVQPKHSMSELFNDAPSTEIYMWIILQDLISVS
jgi:hypothetical protein